MNKEDLSTQEIRLKKILYRSWYRGCKETDKIIGGFVKENINYLTNHDLDELEEILEQSDNDLYDWISGKKNLPDFMNHNKIFQKIKNYTPYKA
jgi:antitoxin CptB